MQQLQKGKYFGIHRKITESNGLIISDTEYTHDKVDWHYHENIYFTFILSGRLYEGNKKESYDCIPGTLLFHNWQEAHYNIKPPGYTRGFHIEIDNKWLQNFSVANSIQTGSMRIEHPAIKSFIRKIYLNSKKDDKEAEISIDELLMQVLNFTGREAENKNSGTPAWVRKIKEILNEEKADKISLGYLSNELSIHPVHISRGFSKYFNTTIGDYLRKIKIEKSALMLNDENKSLSDITYSCGFADQSHFNRCFKEAYNLTPLQYRKAVGFSKVNFIL
jgi:AraC family transcriptional regulator